MKIPKKRCTLCRMRRQPQFLDSAGACSQNLPQCRKRQFISAEKLSRKNKIKSLRGQSAACETCGRIYSLAAAAANNHTGTCRKKCSTRPALVLLRNGHQVKSNAVVVHKAEPTESYKKRSAEFYSSRAWRDLRYRALATFGRACLCCGAKPPGVVLHVDHIKPRRHYPELEMDFNNLQVLCEECNMGKSANYEHDFRQPQ